MSTTMHMKRKKTLKAVVRVQPLPTPTVTSAECRDEGSERRPRGPLVPMGMFEGLQPIVFVTLLYGAVPAVPLTGGARQGTPLQTCVRRGQQAWVVAVNAVVLYSVYRTVRDRALQLSRLTKDDVHDRFVAITSMLVMTAYFLVPVVWIEVPQGVRRLSRLTAPLMRDFGYLVGRCGPLPRLMARTHVFVGLVCSPFLVWAWLFVIAPSGRGSDWMHHPAGTFNITFCFALTTSHVAGFLRMGDFADQMAQQMAAEIASGGMRAHRLREFRASWLDLDKLLKSAVVLTATMCLYMALLTVLSTFFTFQFLVSVRSGFDHFLVTSVFLQAFLWSISSNLICLSADRFAEKVNGEFKKVLRIDLQLEYPLMDSETERELRFFLRLVSRADGAVSVGGFIELTRHTITSQVSAMVSYLIVLIQFTKF